MVKVGADSAAQMVGSECPRSGKGLVKAAVLNQVGPTAPVWLCKPRSVIQVNVSSRVCSLQRGSEVVSPGGLIATREVIGSPVNGKVELRLFRPWIEGQDVRW